ncbi:hypothetical protein BP5796_12800 [Coleophoma crateriformis]|uniref:FAD-binding domain-containing protein n=1 Tax=Coleophoma crateriformis TaxID=565419 RepID=A0A3D8Q6R1_9HELO|nr:hypothetical protein BP5796_12800 [Coleophoma crateriformis]
MAVPPIAIIGGGPCGLTLARLLQQKGIDYIIYERDQCESTSRRGGCLDIHAETGQRAIKECNLFDQFKKYARWESTVLTLADKHGKKVSSIGEGRDAPEIDRIQLRQILLDSIPKEKLHWGQVLKSVKRGDDGTPALEFADGSTRSGFKLVVGADGAWSKVRSMINQAKPKYSGVHYIEATISPNNPLYSTMVSTVGLGSYAAMGSSKQIISMRQGDGSYRAYFGLHLPEDFVREANLDLSNTEAVRSLFLSEGYFEDWAEGLKDFIRHGEDFHSWPLYSLPTESLEWKAVPGFTLAGDAAHLSVPNGEGVNMAMTDALMLANKIAEHGLAEGLDGAVQEYEQEMFPRGMSTIEDGLQMHKAMLSEDAPHSFLQALGIGASAHSD